MIIPYYSVGLIGRFISGLAVGFNSAIVPLYINEIMPTTLTGLGGSFNQGFLMIGNISSYLLCFGFFSNEGSVVKTKDQVYSYWSFVMLFPIITSLFRLLILLFVFPYETPTGALM